VTEWVILNCLLIIVARVADVTLGTLRTVAVINGRRWTAWHLGFVEVLIWVLVVGAVIGSIKESPWYAIAYALGFATGNYLGITIEQYFAHGEQVVRIFTRKGPEMSGWMREQGLRVTMFQGEGRDGPVHMLFIETARRGAAAVVKMARQFDAACFYVVDDVRLASRTIGSPGHGVDALAPAKRK